MKLKQSMRPRLKEYPAFQMQMRDKVILQSLSRSSSEFSSFTLPIIDMPR